MKHGYIRVSTADQNTARQEVLMNQLGVDCVYVDKLSGKNTDRPELQRMLAAVQPGDTVIVESYSRLARSTQDLLVIVEQIQGVGANFISQKENCDTSTPAGRLMMTMFAGLYQFERECMLERQREGIEIARREGKYKGRKPLEIDREKALELRMSGMNVSQCCVELGISRRSWYNLVGA